MIANAVKMNIKIIKIHLTVFLFKSFLFYMSLMPLRNSMNSFFANRTINNNLFQNSDIHGLIEFFKAISSPNSGLSEVISLILSMLYSGILLFFFLFILIDGFIDAGILYAIEKQKSNVFFKGASKHGYAFFKLRLLNSIPYILSLIVFSWISIYMYMILGNNALYLSLLISMIIILFLIKTFDHAKYLIFNNESVFSSFKNSFKHIISNPKQTFMLNIQLSSLFIAGCILYLVFDNFIEINTPYKIWLIFMIHQLALFLKQLLRYTYLTSVKRIINY